MKVKSSKAQNIVMMGATGAVGSCVVNHLLQMKQVKKLTLLGRRPLPSISAEHVHQYKADIFDPETYTMTLPQHQVAICTLGVGQPSKMSKEEFLRIDKTAVLDFASACKEAGVVHFELLSSVGIKTGSPSFYLRTKAELINEIKALQFDRFSVFQPSMILTPTNRYGFAQAVTLKVWPILKPLLMGQLRKYRGIPVDVLGKAMAMNILHDKSGIEYLHWDEFYSVIPKQ